MYLALRLRIVLWIVKYCRNRREGVKIFFAGAFLLVCPSQPKVAKWCLRRDCVECRYAG